MGAIISNCMQQPETTVRVMRSDGETLEFDQAIVAKQLMKAHPGHLVVHCSQVSRTNGLRPSSKVVMMRPDESLVLGQTYCLLRVPSQRANKGLQPKAQNSKAASDGDVYTNYYRLPPLAPLQQHHFGGPWRPHLDAIVESPLNSKIPSPGPSRLAMSPLAREAGYVPMSPARAAPGTRTPDTRESPLRQFLSMDTKSWHREVVQSA